jgi:DNA polymerase-3 subunit delta'
MPFRDIIGHRKLVALLSRSVAGHSLPPSLIFSGPSGIGKQMAAVATAQALNCLAPVVRAPGSSTFDIPEFDACGTCAACARIARGVHPDVLLLEPNDKGNIKIDQVRDAIDRAGYRPFEGRRRVTIINQADGLETSAQNGLLKVLEEPPASSVFILVTRSSRHSAGNRALTVSSAALPRARARRRNVCAAETRVRRAESASGRPAGRRQHRRRACRE